MPYGWCIIETCKMAKNIWDKLFGETFKLEQLKQINFGLGWMLLILAGIVIAVFMLISRTRGENPQLDRTSLVIMLIAIGILLFLLLNIKSIVPSIFQQAVFDLQSIIGLT